MAQIGIAERALSGIHTLLLASFMLAGHAQAEATITWGMLNISPLWISYGPDKGQGIQDQLIHFLETRMPGYEHREVAAPIARVSAEMQNGYHWCTQFIQLPERDDWAYFSLPALIVLPNRIVIRKEQRDRFEQYGTPLELETLLADRSLRLSLERRRSYGPLIDPLLHRQASTSSHISTDQAIKMLLANRFDYLIESPIVASYTAKQLGKLENVVMLPIRGGELPYLVRVACPKNAWGKHVIEEIDAILRVERARPEYREIMERWHGDNDVREIRSNYDILSVKEK